VQYRIDNFDTFVDDATKFDKKIHVREWRNGAWNPDVLANKTLGTDDFLKIVKMDHCPDYVPPAATTEGSVSGTLSKQELKDLGLDPNTPVLIDQGTTGIGPGLYPGAPPQTIAAGGKVGLVTNKPLDIEITPALLNIAGISSGSPLVPLELSNSAIVAVPAGSIQTQTNPALYKSKLEEFVRSRSLGGTGSSGGAASSGGAGSSASAGGAGSSGGAGKGRKKKGVSIFIKEKRIKEGDLIRVTRPVGYIQNLKSASEANYPVKFDETFIGHYLDHTSADMYKLVKIRFGPIEEQYDKDKIPFILVKHDESGPEKNKFIVLSAAENIEVLKPFKGGSSRRKRSRSKPKTRSKTSKRRSRSNSTA
jgi:hypothetical protein